MGPRLQELLRSTAAMRYVASPHRQTEPMSEYSQMCLQQYYRCVQEGSGQRRQFSSSSARKGWQAQPFSMPASMALGQKTNLMSSDSDYKANPGLNASPEITLIQSGFSLATYVGVLVSALTQTLPKGNLWFQRTPFVSLTSAPVLTSYRKTFQSISGMA